MEVTIHSINTERRVLVVQSSDDNGVLVAEKWNWVRYSPKVKEPEKVFKVGSTLKCDQKHLNEFQG